MQNGGDDLVADHGLETLDDVLSGGLFGCGLDLVFLGESWCDGVQTQIEE